jgi:hypothetical protein
MKVRILIVLFGIVGIEALVLEPNPEPIYPQKMEWREFQKVDENGIGVYDEYDRAVMEQKWVPKEFDPKTDSVFDGVPVRNIVYFCLCVLCFFTTGSNGYLIFTGSVLALVENGYLPADVPGTYRCVWGMFWMPIVWVVYCLYASYQTLKK